MNEDVRALKDTLENLYTQKSTPRGNLTGFFCQKILNLRQIKALNF